MTTTRKHDSSYDQVTSIARQAIYRFAACTLMDPRYGSWNKLTEFRNDLLVEEAVALLRSQAELEDVTLGPGELPPSALCVEGILRHLPDFAEAMNRIYEQTFGLLVSSPCPPYESEYIDGKFVFQRSNALADLNGFYAAFGLKVSDERPERPDHIVLQLEFMAHLIGLERAAAEVNDAESAERHQLCHRAQARFIREHPVWWVPAFAKLLRRADPAGFYGAVGTFLGAWIAIERTSFGVPAPVRGAAPSEMELAEMCDSCQMES